MISPIARFKTMLAGEKIFFVLSVLVLSVAFCHCGRSPLSVKVRDLYLGMPMNDAVKRVEAMYRQVEGSRFRILQWRQWDSFSVHTDRETEMDITIGNSDNGIRFICFNPGLTDKLFDSASLSADQLARWFAEEYHLPALEHRINRNPPQPEHYWEYVSSRGWKVFITQAKALVLQDWRPQENEK
jgi:hypothetical protein